MVKKTKQKTDNNNRKRSIMANCNKHSWKTILIALYLTFLILSVIPFIAERALEPPMQDSYSYHLTFHKDGQQSHYYVERLDTGAIGEIDLVYTTATNSIVVETENIKVLHIDCRSMYNDECKNVFDINPEDNTNYYKLYFTEKDHLNINVDTDNEIEELSFIDTPRPYQVVVNGVTWTEGVDYSYTEDLSLVLASVPTGQSTIDIYFKSDSKTGPIAILHTSKTLVKVNESILFDASMSYDLDGAIVAYNFDFGDSTFYSSEQITHSYSKPGTYEAILTVRDNDYLVDYAYEKIIVIVNEDIPEILGHVPDQVKSEDSPPWTLDLSLYKPKPTNVDIKYQFYLTGENTSLFTVIGENSTDDNLLFTPVPNAFGSDLVTLKLTSTENVTVSQPLRINITPLNDPPTIKDLPDLIVHYDESYLFDYEPYIKDIDTMKNKLSLSIDDGGKNDFIFCDGTNAIFNYPRSMDGDLLYATVKISDGDGYDKDVISIYISNNQAPTIKSQLPDITLLQGTTKHNVFDLDYYFSDIDGYRLHFNSSKSNLNIQIHPNNTVDISALSEWSGSELVTFRAHDGQGAIKEQFIKITVLEVDDPPEISVLPELFIRYSHDYRFDLTPYIHDDNQKLEELSISISDPVNIRIDPTSNLELILNYPIEYLNTRVQVLITVSDRLNSSIQFLNVTIIDNYPPELTTQLPNVVFFEDTSLTNAFYLDTYFSDPDDSILDYTIFSEFIIATTTDFNFVNISAPLDWFGVEAVCFRATDPNGAFQETQIMITVLPVNDAPSLEPLPEQIGKENERWILDLTEYIVDVDNDLSELDIVVDDYNVVVSGSTLIFLGSPNTRDFVEIMVRDGEFSDSRLMSVQIELAERPQAPSLWDTVRNYILIILMIEILTLLFVAFVQFKRGKYIVEEVFLIYKGGVLIGHLTRDPQTNIDDEIFSGMFTAVQEFIYDSFARNDPEASSKFKKTSWVLDELKLGDSNILIERSTNTYLAIIYSGKSSKRLRKIAIRLLNEIECEFGMALHKWDGNLDKVEGSVEILRILIKPLERSRKRSKLGKKTSRLTDNSTNKIKISNQIKEAFSAGKTSEEGKPSDNSSGEKTQKPPSAKANQIENLYKNMKPSADGTDQVKTTDGKSADTPLLMNNGLNSNPIQIREVFDQDQQKTDQKRDISAPIAIKIDPKKELPSTHVLKMAKATSTLNDTNINHSDDMRMHNTHQQTQSNNINTKPDTEDTKKHSKDLNEKEIELDLD